MSNKIPVLEVFGPTIQGEGTWIGRKTMFVRTAGCDYQCTWCDSKFTWDGTEKAAMLSPSEVYSKLVEVGGTSFNHVTLSGGNPALIGNPIGELISLLHTNDIMVAVETQGSVVQTWFKDVDELTVSPKPPSSGMVTDYSLLSDLIADYAPVLKVVVFDLNDYEYARDMHNRFPRSELVLQVGNSLLQLGAGVVTEGLRKLTWLVDLVSKDAQMNSVRVLPQLHTLLWGNQRGV